MLWLVPLLPMLAALLLYPLTRKGPSRAVYALLANGVVLVTALLLAAAAAQGWDAHLRWSPAISLTLGLNKTAVTVAFLVLAIAFAVLLYASGHEEKTGLPRLLAVKLFFVGAMLLLVLAADFLVLLIAWEIVGLCSWALIGHKWWHAHNMGEANYAFIATRLGDLGLFFAAAVIFTQTQSFSYAEIGQLDRHSLGLLTAGVVLAAAAKSAQLPFSPWIFRAMAGPSSVSALLHAATMVAAGAYLLLRLQPQLQSVEWFAETVIVIGLATALAGSLLAIVQTQIKEVTAASTAAHYGLMFIAVGAGYPLIALLHMLVHAAFKASLFLTAGIAGKHAGSWRLQSMGFGHQLPYVASIALISTLALAGVPPMGGGWSKEAITTVADHVHKLLGLTLVVITAFTACYASRFQMLAFGRARANTRQPDASANSHHVGRMENGALALLAGFTLVLSLLWFPAINAEIAAWFGTKLPRFKPGKLLLSLFAIVIGIYAARVVVRSPMSKIQEKSWLDWFALPVLLRMLVIRPVSTSASRLAYLDDEFIDWPANTLPGFTGKTCKLLLFIEDRWLGRFTDAVSHFALRLSQIGSRIGETFADSFPRGVSSIIATAGDDVRSLQTGMSHQYYLLIFSGLGFILFVLVFTML